MTLSASSNRARREIHSDSEDKSYSNDNDEQTMDDGEEYNQLTNSTSGSQKNSPKEPKKFGIKKTEENDSQDSDSQNNNNNNQNNQIIMYGKIINKLKEEGIELTEEQINKLHTFKQENNASKVEVLKLYSEFMIENYNKQNFDEEEEEEEGKENQDLKIEKNNKDEEAKKEKKESKKLNNKEINEKVESDNFEDDINDDDFENEKIGKNKDNKKEKNNQNAIISQKKLQEEDPEISDYSPKRSPNSSKKSLNKSNDYSPTPPRRSFKPNQIENYDNDSSSDERAPRYIKNKNSSKRNRNNFKNEIPDDISNLPTLNKNEVPNNAKVEEVIVDTKIPNVKLLKLTRTEYYSDYSDESSEGPKKNSNKNRRIKSSKKSEKYKQTKRNSQTKPNKQLKSSSKSLNKSGKQKRKKSPQNLNGGPKRSMTRSKSVDNTRNIKNNKSRKYNYFDNNYSDEEIPKKTSQRQKKDQPKIKNEFSYINNNNKNISKTQKNQVPFKKARSSNLVKNNQKSLVQESVTRKRHNSTLDRSGSPEIYNNDYNQYKINTNSAQMKMKRSSSVDFRKEKKSKQNQEDETNIGFNYRSIIEHPEDLDNELSLNFFKNYTKTKENYEIDNNVWKRNRYNLEPFPNLSESYSYSSDFPEEESEFYENDDENDENEFNIIDFDDELPAINNINWKFPAKDILTPVQNANKAIRGLALKYDTDSLFPNKHLKKKKKKSL